MVNEEKQSEFLKTAGSFAEYMMKEYGQPKDGRSMLLIASDDDKSLVSFIGKKIDGCKSIVNMMLTNDDIDELLNVSCSSAKMMRRRRTINISREERLLPAPPLIQHLPIVTGKVISCGG